MSDSLQPHGLYSPWNSPVQNTGVGSLSFLQGIFPTQGLNPGLLHCRRMVILQGKPKNTGVGSLSLLQGIFPTQESNQGLKYGRWILYQLSYQGLHLCYCQVTSVVTNSVQPHRWQPTRLPHPWDSPSKNTGVGCHFLLQGMKSEK